MLTTLYYTTGNYSAFSVPGRSRSLAAMVVVACFGETAEVTTLFSPRRSAGEHILLAKQDVH